MLEIFLTSSMMEITSVVSRLFLCKYWMQFCFRIRQLLWEEAHPHMHAFAEAILIIRGVFERECSLCSFLGDPT